ncbi:MAG: metallophosphoesterase [Cystobacterineae bacterium]|nr:metallophosphoesterase [Cystobacterineae bacterium]
MRPSLGSLVFFSTAMCLIPGLGTYLVYSRWLRPPIWPFEAKTAVLALMWALWLSVPLGAVGWHLLGHTRFSPLAAGLSWLGYFWLGVLFYAACALALSGLALWLAHFFCTPSLLLRQCVAATCALSVLSACAYGAWVAARGPRVVEHEVVLDKLSPAFDGFRVAVISDMHLGPTLGRAFSEKVVAQLNALDADVIAVLGDLADGSVYGLAEAVAPFQNLRAKHGVLFVTGNHEYFMGAQAWVAHLSALGFRVLANERVEITLPSPQGPGYPPARLAFAGIHDLMANRLTGAGLRSDLPAALEGWDKKTPLVLLSHQPGPWKQAQEAGVDLQLSGHTHGGQMWPFHFMVAWTTPRVQGFYRQGASLLYVTPGAGYWGPPLRVGAPPEIALLRLRAGGQGPV